MLIRPFLLASAVLVSPLTASAQNSTTSPSSTEPTAEEPKSQLYAGWAPKVVLRRDQIRSERLSSGPALLSFAAGYAYDGELGAHRVDGEFFKSTVRSQKDFEYLNWPDAEERVTEGDPLTSIRLRYGYLFNLKRNDKLALRLGPALDVDIQHGTYVYGPYGVDGYYGVFSLDARAEAAYRLAPKHRLTAGLGLPLFAWTARSPYALNDDEQIMDNIDHDGFKTFFRYIGNGQFRTWNQLQAVRLSARYDYAATKRLMLSVRGQARVLSITKPRPLLATDYGADFLIGFRF